MKKLIFILFLNNFIYSQEFKTGLIMPTKNFKTCCIYIPISGLKTYESPNGKINGKIYLGKPDNNNEFYSSYFESNKVKKNMNNYSIWEWVTTDDKALIFVDKKKNFLKIKEKLWLKKDELKTKDLKLTSWVDYAIEKKTQWFSDNYGLNLRSTPSKKGKIIMTLRGELLGFFLTNERKGKWFKVKVNQYKKEFSSEIVKTYFGWVKLISDDGTLNVVASKYKGC